MAASFKYWDDCVSPENMEVMWNQPDIQSEWVNAGETKGQKVHMSRDPDGQPYLTQTEMMAVAEIIACKHFDSTISPEMICAIATLESDRQPLATRYDRKTKRATLGIMQILPETAQWLASEEGYNAYRVERKADFLYRPFESVYFGAAYLKYLSNYSNKEKDEEFVVRAYKGGTKKATHKSTVPYWKNYLSVKGNLPSRAGQNNLPNRMGRAGFRNFIEIPSPFGAQTSPASPTSPISPTLRALPTAQSTGSCIYWDSRVSTEDMEDMWNDRMVSKEWNRTRERRGAVRFSCDQDKRPYLTRVELKAIAEIIVSKHFSPCEVNPALLCALAETISMRLVDGYGEKVGLMGIEHSTASWLYLELGYKAYRVEYAVDLVKPFVSMYFGAAYCAWLLQYEGRKRTLQFVVSAYFCGPNNVDNLPEMAMGTNAAMIRVKFEQALNYYGEHKSDGEKSGPERQKENPP